MRHIKAVLVGARSRLSFSVATSSALRASCALFVLAMALSPMGASAQTRWGEEYAKRIHASEQVSPLTDDMFGDHVNLFDGTVEFRTTDISLPGNNDLPVELTRTFSTTDDSWPTAIPTAIAGWHIDVPYLRGTFAQSDQQDMSCSRAVQPPSITVIGSMDGQPYVFRPKDYWSGNHLHAPGGGGELLAPLTDPKIAKPTFAVSSPWTTKDGWYFSCVPVQVQPQPQVPNLPPLYAANSVGEGFVGYAPDGKKYTFDWKVTRPDHSISQENDIGTRAALLERVDVRLYATKVEDRFGNWVKYEWEGNELVHIKASDGRQIDLNYAPATQAMDSGLHDPAPGSGVATFRFLLSATAAGRTWTYNSGPNGEVKLPDGSKWQYIESTTSPMGFLQFNYPQGHIDPHNAASPWGDIMDYVAPCTRMPRFDATTNTLTVVHPSGAQAQFTFVPMRHGHTNVPSSCANRNPSDSGFKSSTRPLMHDVMSLTQKRITGPGVAQGDYTYGYAGLEGDFDMSTDGSPTPTPPPHYKTVTVTQPDGTQVINTFGKDYGLNEGQLAKVQVVKGGTTYRTTTNTYIAESDVAAQPFPSYMGDSVMQYADEWGAAAVRPLVGTTIVQDGVTFKNEVTNVPLGTSFDQFAHRVSVTRSSIGNAGGDSSRTEVMTFVNDKDKWVVGLPKSTTCTTTGPCTPSWAPSGIIMSQTDYDAATDLPIRSYSFGALQATMTYNPDATLATVKDGNNNVLTLSNWKRGLPQSIQFPATPDSPSGSSKTAAVNDSGWLTSITDETGSITNYSYDLMGRMSRVDYPTEVPAWSATTFGFSIATAAEYGLPAGHWKSTSQTGNGLTTTYYDAHWRPVLVQTEDTGNAATRHFVVKRYDLMGREIFSSYPVTSLTSVNDALKGTTTSYDALGRPTQSQQDSELGTLTTSTQYLSGFQSKTTNPRLFSTTTKYQVFDSPSTDAPVSVVRDIKLSPLDQATTSIARDIFGKTTAITRSGNFNSTAVSATRSYVYDVYQRLCKTINPEAGATLVDYDGAGNIAWSADGTALTSLACDRASVAATAKTVRSYDARNRPLVVDYPSTTNDPTYTYFPDGSVKTLSNGGVVWTYAYNKRNLPVTEALTLSSRPGVTKTITHGYDANGFESSLTYPSGLVVGTAPNALGQATKAGTWASGVTYYANGAMSGFTYGNGIVHSMWENDRGLPDRVLEQKSGSPSVLDDSYDYDYNGNVAAITDGTVGGAGNRTMSYDGLDRLLSTHAPGLAWIDATTTYDPLDNIRNNTVGSRNWNYTYNTTNNRLTQLVNSAGVGQRSVGYDARGNITQDGALFNVFDTANRLISVTNKESYLYDGYGRRVQVQRTSDGKLSYPVYSLSGQLISEDDQRSNKYTDYVSLNGSLVAKRTAPWGTSTWTSFFEHTDALHSAVIETDASGVASHMERYSPYGEQTDGNYEQGPAFGGHVTDAATGFSYMQQRYYDPVLGRFLSVDPVAPDTKIGNNFNRYWYGNDNPYKMIDPDGRLADCPWYIPWCRTAGKSIPQSESMKGKDSAPADSSSDGADSFQMAASKKEIPAWQDPPTPKPAAPKDEAQQIVDDYVDTRHKTGYITTEKNKELGTASRYVVKKTAWGIVKTWLTAEFPWAARKVFDQTGGKAGDDAIDDQAKKELEHERHENDNSGGQ